MAEVTNLVFENFGKTIALVLIVALAVIALFKIDIKFDLNDHLKARKVRSAKKAQHYCPHMEFRVEDEGAMQISWFESPPGTISWICKNCNYTVNHIDRKKEEKDGEYWLANTNKYKRNIRKYNFYAKRSL